MYYYYEVLQDDVVIDSNDHKYQTGDRLVMDESRTNILLDTIANYQAVGALSSRSQTSDISPKPFKVKEKGD